VAELKEWFIVHIIAPLILEKKKHRQTTPYHYKKYCVNFMPAAWLLSWHGRVLNPNISTVHVWLLGVFQPKFTCLGVLSQKNEFLVF
jgi:hypothetical protein